MNLTGKYVRTNNYLKVLKKYGFKYTPMTKSFFLSYPFIPKDYEEQAVKVQLASVGHAMSLIDSIDYYEHGSGYIKTDKPDKGFKEYVEHILEEGLMSAHPKYIPA